MDDLRQRLVGSRAAGLLATGAWLAEQAAAAHVVRVDIATAYWGPNTVEDALALVPDDGAVRLLLWDLGGTKDRLVPLLADAAGDDRADVRFIGGTEEGGTFHPKVIGLADRTGPWHGAVVGSANFTRNAQVRNVEIGVEVQSPRELAQLQSWFEGEFDAALPARDVDVDRALAALPDRPPRRGSGFAPPSGVGA